MADAPSPPWVLSCKWCEFKIVVNARGMRGADMGSGVQAADMMEDHIIEYHDKTWSEFIAKTN